MPFSMKIASHTPISSNKLNEVLENFLLDIGYLSGRKEGEELYNSIPFRLWTDCFLRDTERVWTVDEMANKLQASKPSVYRHLNKLKNLDIIESKDIVVEDNGEVIKKGYRIRHGDLVTAWHITEANVESALKRYRESIAKIDDMIKKG
ncbi:MAG: winged helix-turn-helix domain-containing protein [Thermoplasmata archaeon]